MSPEGVKAALSPESGAGIEATSLASPIAKASPKYRLTPPSSSALEPLMYKMDEGEGPMKTNSETLLSPSQSLMFPVFRSSFAHLEVRLCFSNEYLLIVRRAKS